MELYVCMLRLFLFASLCCACVLPSSTFASCPVLVVAAPCRGGGGGDRAQVVPQGVSLLLFASVPATSRCILQKLHLALVQFVAAACAFSGFDNLLLAVMH